MSEEIGVCEYVMVPKHLMKLLGQDIYGEYRAYDRQADWEDDDDDFVTARTVAEDIGGFWIKFVQFMPELAKEIEKEFEQEEHDEQEL